MITYDPDRIRPGMVVKDELTGLEGTVVCITHWLHGCVRVTIQPKDVKDGKPAEGYTFDEPQAVIVNAEAPFVPAPRHGDRPDPVDKPDPTR